MKRVILFIAFFIFANTTLAWAQQTASVRAIVVDEVSKEPMSGVVVSLISSADSTKAYHYMTAAQGVVEMPKATYGEYKMTLSFLGYEPFSREVTVDSKVMDLGYVGMMLKSQMLSTAFVDGQAMRTSQKGDTLTYNASAFKVAQDADAEALLAKMPGIKVVNGVVEAQGETVKKVFVDGKEFFGQDVNAAIKNLPAEVVSKVEVYNKLSDQAEFSGVDDGEGFKAINIVTNISRAQFGKIYAGYGFDDKYMGGANVNFFSGEHRFSIMAMANNMNQQNFSVEDVLGAVGGGSGGRSSRRGGGGSSGFMMPQMDGTSTTQSFGLNYIGKWWKKLDVSGSYFFNNSKNENQRESDRQYFDPEWIERGFSSSETRNNEHRFNARIDYKINDNHQLMMRPSVSFQNYKSYADSWSETAEMIAGAESPLSRLASENESRNWGYTISNALIYRTKLGKSGRTITAEIGGSMGKNDSRGLRTNEFGYNTPPDSVAGQRSLNDNNNYSLNGMFMYTEPVSENSQINAQYRVSYRYSDIDRKTHLWDENLGVGGGYDPDFSPDYSNIYNSGYITHRVGPGFNYSKERNRFVASVFYQRSTLTNNQDYPTLLDMDKTFNNVTYFAMLNRTFNPSTTMRIYARSGTRNPSVSQLQDVIDISNPKNITIGNPDLKPSYENMVYANFIKSNITKGRTFMINARFSLQNDYITDSLTLIQDNITQLPLPSGNITLERGSQLSKAVNMNGYWNTGGGVSYGFPVKWLKSNLNLNLNAQYSESPSIINAQRNTLSTQYYNAGLVLGSNISEKIDFTISYSGGYNIANNSIRSDYNNEYMSQSASLRFKWVAWLGFSLSGNAAYIQNRGITDSYNDEYVMCNLYIGKKVFKNQRGEITFGVNDLLNQKTSFKRNVTNEYIENVKNNVMGRYYGIQFVYNLRNYGKSANSTSSFRGEPDSIGRPTGGHGGPPPSGGGGGGMGGR